MRGDEMKPLFDSTEFSSVFMTERMNDYEDVADYVNSKIQKLIDEAPVVYKYQDKIISYWNSEDVLGRPDNPTHKARLMFIEPIKKECVKHEPTINYALGISETMNPICRHCHVKLEAVWTERK
jgi:hypothetical protein